MKKMSYAAFAVLVLGLMAAVWQPGFAQDKAAKGRALKALKVKLHYTGSGTVDEKHTILTFLFDSPEFVRGGAVIPFAVKDAASKDGVVVFINVDRSPYT
jgi:predicted secreted protein